MSSRACRWGLIALAAALAMTAPASTQNRAEMGVIAQLEPGRWEVRELDTIRPAPVRSICVADPAILLQLQHRDVACSRLVIESDAKSATVHYTCPTGGFGRTTLKASSPRLVRIETQGIDRKLPFEFSAELRRKGNC